MTYLNAVKAAGSTNSEKVMAELKKMKIDDMFTNNGKIRADGLMEHEMYIMQVKKPERSQTTLGLLQAGSDHVRRRSIWKVVRLGVSAGCTLILVFQSLGHREERTPGVRSCCSAAMRAPFPPFTQRCYNSDRCARYALLSGVASDVEVAARRANGP